MTSLAEKLKERLPPSDITQQQLKERSWWSGPDLYVLIDDYDLVALDSSGANVIAFANAGQDDDWPRFRV